MKNQNQNQKESFPVLYENKIAFSQFMGGLKSCEEAMDRIAKLYNALEIGIFSEEELVNIYKPAYFKEKFESTMKAKLDKLDLPTTLKERLFQESVNTGSFAELGERLNALQLNGNTWGHIPMNGGTRAFQVKVEYFQTKNGVVTLVPDIEERTIKQFQILGDTPEKIKIFDNLKAIADYLTELSSLLEETGLFPAYSNPIVISSPLLDFDLESNTYEVKPGYLL